MNRNQGRKPKPTNLHVLHGTFNATRHGKERKGDVEPEPLDNEMSPPEILSPRAKVHWKDIIASLGTANILANMDIDALILYCENWAKWSEANENIEKFGMVIRSPKDNKTPVLSPYFTISLKTGDQLRRLLTQFGMTPVARIGLKGKKHEPEPEEGSFEAWQKKRAANKGA